MIRRRAITTLLKPQGFEITAASFPERDRVEAFRSFSGEAAGMDYEYTSQSSDAFDCDIEIQPLVNASIIEIRKTSHLITHGAEIHARRAPSIAILQVCHRGDMTGAQGDALVHAEAGDALLMYTDVVFNDISYFNRSFRARFGNAPGEMRNNGASGDAGRNDHDENAN